MNLPLVLGMAAVLISSVLALLEMGRRIGMWRRDSGTSGTDAGLAPVGGAVFSVMGLMIAFTFQGAAARFDMRKHLIGQEANLISTAYLRLDLLPAAAQPELREEFRTYIDARLGFYKNLSADPSTAWAEQARSEALQGRIWALEVARCKEQESPATTTLVLSSLNEMMDITTTQVVAIQTHPPEAIFWGLVVLVFSSALLAGHAMAQSEKRSWIHMIVYASVLSAAIYVTLDYEYPRFGMIKIDPVVQMLIDVRDNMK